MLSLPKSTAECPTGNAIQTTTAQRNGKHGPSFASTAPPKRRTNAGKSSRLGSSKGHSTKMSTPSGSASASDRALRPKNDNG